MNIYNHKYRHRPNQLISVEDAWKIASSDQDMKDDFHTNFSLFNTGINPPYELGPIWAYWFSRFVINDSWPSAVDLIKKDELAYKLYTDYVELLNYLKINGHSQPSETIKLDEHGLIISIEGLRTNRKKNKSLNMEMIDRITADVERIKRERKIRSLFED